MVRVFVSYDQEHDSDLCDRLVGQASAGGGGFEITARSALRLATDPFDDVLRGAIREADEAIVICGAHTGDSLRVSAELRMIREEAKPYFLLWGRRELMCTRPSTATSTDSIYTWTWATLRHQVHEVRRLALYDATHREPV